MNQGACMEPVDRRPKRLHREVMIGPPFARPMCERRTRQERANNEEVAMIPAHVRMTEGPVTISMSATVRDAVRLLQTLEVRHLPVVDEDGTLVGMLSDRDL